MMWQKLTYKQRKLMLIGGMVIVTYIAFRCSFIPTLKAIQVNHELQQSQIGEQAIGNSFDRLDAEHDFYLKVLKGYKVKNEDRENRLWQTVSGMAQEHDIQISFDPNPRFRTDTIAVSNGLIAEQFNFKGSYVNMVKLLDTLSKSTGIGKVSLLKLSTNTEAQGQIASSSLTLQLTLMAIVQ